MGATYTFIIILVLLVLLSSISYFSIRFWHSIKIKELELAKIQPQNTSISFTLPEQRATFGNVVSALAEKRGVVVNYENFDEIYKEVKLVGGRQLNAPTTKRAIELIANLVRDGEQLLPYEVVGNDSLLIIMGRD